MWEAQPRIPRHGNHDYDNPRSMERVRMRNREERDREGAKETYIKEDVPPPLALRFKDGTENQHFLTGPRQSK